jgi:hypothetical protein
MTRAAASAAWGQRATRAVALGGGHGLLLLRDYGAGAMGGENEAGRAAEGDSGHVDRLGVCPLVSKFMQPPLFRLNHRCHLLAVHIACAEQCLRRVDLLNLQSSLSTWLLSGSRESLEIGQFFVLLPVGEQQRPCGSQRLSTSEIGRDREKRERRMNITHCSM